ncbi:Mrp/NBP35 family ATP-binding protein [Bartonella sp. HY761]|uniref:Mrp/NBP35 family ATP-binding protein n=1 Tax=Bartonella sp. HY761 TaxID=2979330 RepID=UPI00220F27D5|nr:Mrp/NBP35 family ATP-binding protein [Bartonella sp. HY761]UXN05477.1 Mrp/NBP35 family ATP-binding protein [Bartonella sp. HY761]
MSALNQDIVLSHLRAVKGPDFESDIVSLGLVSEIFIADKKVFFSINVPANRAEELEPLRLAAEKTVLAIDGVKSAIVTLTAEKRAGDHSGEVKRPTKPIVQKSTPASSHPHKSSDIPPRTPIPGVKHVIAVASGKGGVGKSTTAINLALALMEQGLNVGIMDGDIYGPSLPRLTAIYDKPEAVEGKKLLPLEKYNLKLMSMGFLVSEDTPMVWRGPMVMSAITQMLRDVLWAPLDVLVVDMPPGTGDAQLTLAQQVQLSGAVIVSTPQDLALIDARKGIEMFSKVGIPILGVIENMSYFIAPDTGKRYDIFGHGGARQEAEKRKLTFLGEIPLDPDIRVSGDDGKPIILASPNGAHAAAYRNIAETISAKLQLT